MQETSTADNIPLAQYNKTKACSHKEIHARLYWRPLHDLIPSAEIEVLQCIEKVQETQDECKESKQNLASRYVYYTGADDGNMKHDMC